MEDKLIEVEVENGNGSENRNENGDENRNENGSENRNENRNENEGGNVSEITASETVLAEYGGSKNTGVRIGVAAALVIVVALALFGGLQYNEKVRFEKELASLNNTYTEIYRYVNSLTVPRFESMVAEGEDFLISIGRPNCPYCDKMDPSFIKLVQELDMTEDIYYLNVASIHGIEGVWPPFKEKYGFFYTPAYMHYADGEIVSAMDGDFTEDDLRAWLLDNGAK
ncbi:MAG: thioredoxin family protein [Clostridiales Family XIII bacterium]|jgi:predicted bacteriocin transport accessory protein|nr:thioredoxin family protein [Clostridiales Family XIII bacterium]